MLNRQVRISVAGKYQFSISVPQDDPLDGVAARAHEAMKLSDTFKPVISVGQINFMPS